MQLEKEQHSHALNEKLRFVDERIKMHLKNRELEAALVLSRDMIALAEGNRTDATALELLPKAKSSKPRLSKNASIALSIVVFAYFFALTFCWHHQILATAYDWLYDRDLYSQARVVAQAEVFLSSLHHAHCSEASVAVADTYANEGDNVTTRRLLISELAHYPTNARAYSLLSHIEWNAGNLPLAERAFKQQFGVRTAYWNTLVCDLANVQAAQGKISDANYTLSFLKDSEPLTNFQRAEIQLMQGNAPVSCQSFELAFKNLSPLTDIFDQYRILHHLEYYSQALLLNGDEAKSKTIAAQAKALKDKLSH